MLRLTPRNLIRLIALTLPVSALAVWLAHGRVLFSVAGDRGTDDGRALERLFEPTGVQDELGALRGMDRGFRLGLLPSGGWSGWVSVSSATVVAAGLLVVSSARRPSGASRRDRSRRRACPSAADR